MKKTYLLVAMSLMVLSCGKKEASPEQEVGTNAPRVEVEAPAEETAAVSDDPMQNKGIGPVSSVEIPAEIDQDMAAKGKATFETKCTACHKPDVKFIGPAPKGILERRSPEWVMNMILNPEEMIQKDPIAKQLLAEANGAPMANQNLTEEEARQVLEYFRTIE
ncbi:Cytochrome c, mono- and diheme variants [Candidatus Ornithobacterium hominis]|uniref:c-type cytochrome n=1 Tax=Candidatus Ornithobacterium hominis TaxID=2497989 RepID=UPI0024BC5443|nr:cytochrome c [Candidatus Ornithobacterium hominis]CAI9430423.1 Cytochrome c, mono- and diheme variants [Candidatus Ornithobacterium hominis]